MQLELSRSTHGTLVRLLFACVAVAFFSLVGGPLTAVADDTSTITWSVRPASAEGADGRSWAELELDPGESVVEHAAVRNLSDEVVTFTLAAADGYFTENDRFNMLPADQESVAAGTWIDIADTVTVNPGETVVVPYTVTVPENAEPGDHAAGVAASIESTQAGDGNQLSVQSRVGFRVMTRVTGDLVPALEIADETGAYKTSWNPFAPGDLTVSFDVVNTGNARLQINGTAEAAGQSAQFPEGEDTVKELLPGDRKAVTVQLENVWPLGLIVTDIVVDATVVSPDGVPPAEFEAVESQITVWAVPWPQLIILLGVALIVLALVTGRIRSKRKVSALIAEARAEGERAAQEQTSGSDVSR